MQKNKSEDLLRSRDGLTRFSVDMLVMLVSLLVVACYLNGMNALWRALISCAAAVACEAAGRLIFSCPGSLKDMSAVVTGLMLALMLPAVCPLWLPALGSAFAIAVVKIPFGGARKTPFVPAAAGWCFLSVCFSEMVFTFSPVNTGASSAVFGSDGFVSGTTLASMLRVGQSLTLNLFGATNLLTGRMPGAMGTTCILALIGAAVYLLFKRPARLIVSGGFLAVCCVMAFLFPRVLTGRMSSLALELSAGTLLFVAVFVLNDPVTSPKKPLHAFIYGALAGLLCMLLRYWGKYNDSACFSVLIMNAVWPAVEDYKDIVINALKDGAIPRALKQLHINTLRHKKAQAESSASVVHKKKAAIKPDVTPDKKRTAEKQSQNTSKQTPVSSKTDKLKDSLHKTESQNTAAENAVGEPETKVGEDNISAAVEEFVNQVRRTSGNKAIIDKLSDGKNNDSDPVRKGSLVYSDVDLNAVHKNENIVSRYLRFYEDTEDPYDSVYRDKPVSDAVEPRNMPSADDNEIFGSSLLSSAKDRAAAKKGRRSIDYDVDYTKYLNLEEKHRNAGDKHEQ